MFSIFTLTYSIIDQNKTLPSSPLARANPKIPNQKKPVVGTQKFS